MKRKNPWLGLASYEEPKGSDNYLFCGRDQETLDMVRLIDNKLFTTLYGSSGIGKTSLLKAGVTPILRRKGYYPIYVRLSQEGKNISYAETIVQKIKKSGLDEKSDITLKQSNGSDIRFLWEYFATTSFYYNDREVYPVIILDQFEEVFRNSDKTKADLLLKQVYFLLNDELEIPDKEGWSADTNYRFVASIREDFLFVLEDSIDENSLILYKNNRYRLRPMKPEQAREVVLIPGQALIKETEKEAVVKRVIKLSTNSKYNSIDTLLLSLVCASTFEKKGDGQLELADFDFWGDNPMRVYYQDAICQLNNEQVRYIQTNLINKDGSRIRLAKKTLARNLGQETLDLLLTSEHRVLAFDPDGKVELLHDQLARVIFEDRDAYEERERNWRFMEMQSRFVAEKAKSLASSDSYLARLLAVEVLPKDLQKPDRPYTTEAEMALRESCEHETGILTGHQSSVYSAAYSHDGNRIVSASRDKNIIVWDTKSGAILKIIENAHEDVISFVTFSADDRYILTASWDKSLKLFNAETYLCEKTFIGGHDAPVVSASYCPNGKLIVSASKDKEIILWDTQTGEGTPLKKSEPSIQPNAESNKYYPVAISPNGKYIVYVSSMDTIVLWNVWKRRYEQTLFGHENTITSLSFSTNGKRILSSSFDKTIRIWNTRSGLQLEAFLNPKSRVLSAAFSPDNKYIVSAAYDNTIRTWKSNHEKPLTTFKGHESKVRSIAFSPDGNYIVSASSDNSVRIWESFLYRNTLTKKSIKQNLIQTHDNITISLLDNKIHLLDTITGNEIAASKKGHTRRILSASFSPNGKHIVSVSHDGIIIIWSAGDLQPIWTFDSHCKNIKNICFNSDGKMIIANTYLGETIPFLFPLPLQNLIDQTRERFKDRPLSAEERRMYYLE